MLELETATRHDALIAVARKMMTAARTAPKAKGVDTLEIGMVTGPTIEKLAVEMERLAQVLDKPFFNRDAQNIRRAEAIVLIGTSHRTQGLNCGYCGWATCAEKPQEAPCFFNAHDMGVAIGSATAMAADCRVDSRVMFSVGYTAKMFSLLEGCQPVLAVPISASGKSPFFDR